MVNHTEVKRLSGGADPHGGGGLHNVTGRVECEAEPVANGTNPQDEVS